VLLKLVGLAIPLRAESADETTGLDVTQHGEEAYIHSQGVSLGGVHSTPAISKAAPQPHGEPAATTS
jgi:hypothetical protein